MISVTFGRETVFSTKLGAGGKSESLGERGGLGIPGDGSSIGALSVPADADHEEAATIVAAITKHLRVEACAAEADDDAETREGSLWTASVRMDRPLQTSVATVDVPTDPWVAASRMR